MRRNERPPLPALVLAAIAAFAATSAFATGWTWKNPLPSGARLTTLTTARTGEVVVAGYGSTSLRRTAGGWQPLFSGAAVSIAGSWSGATGTFAAGLSNDEHGGRLLRLADRAWEDLGPVDVLPTGLQGLPTGVVWIVGSGTSLVSPTVVRWSGQGSTVEKLEEESGFATAIWGTADDDLWVIGTIVEGAEPRLYHRTAEGWTQETLPASTEPDDEQAPLRLWGTGRAQPMLATFSPAIRGLRLWQKGPSGWSELAAGPGLYATALTGTADGRIALAANDSAGEETVVLVREGEVWKRERTGTSRQLLELKWLASGELWAVGDSGSVLRRDASGWTDLLPARRDDFTGAAREADGSLLFCANDTLTEEGRIVRRDASGFTTVASEPGSSLSDLNRGSDGVLRVAGTDWISQRGFVWTRSDGWKKETVTEPGVRLLQVFLSTGGLLAGGADIPPEGEDFATARIYLRKPDGTWVPDFASETPSEVQVLFQPPGEPPMAFLLEPAEQNGGDPTSVLLVRAATGWERALEVTGVTVTGAVSWPGAPTIVVGHDEKTGTGVVYRMEGRELTKVYTSDRDSGEVYLFSPAGVGPGDVWVVGLSSSLGMIVLHGVDGAFAPAAGYPSNVPANGLLPVSATEVWAFGPGGALLLFDGGSDIAAVKGPGEGGAEVRTATHRSSALADLAGWYALAPSTVPVSDVMDVVAACGAGSFFDLQLVFTPQAPVESSALRLWTVDDALHPRLFFLAPGYSPPPESAFTLLDPAGSVLGPSALLSKGVPYTVRFTVRDGGFARHDLDPEPGRFRGSVLLTTR